MSNNVKLSQEKAKQIYAKYGFTLISEYQSERQKCLCVDKNGYRYGIRIDNLCTGCNPTLWGVYNKDNLEFNLNLFLSKFPVKYHSYKIVKSKRKTMILVSLICSCGNVFVVPLIKLVYGKYKNLLCNECKKKLYPAGIKKKREDYLNAFSKWGYIVEYAPEKMSAGAKVSLIDKFGFKGVSSFASCKMNKHFSTFDIRSNRENFVYNANLLLRQNNYDTKCIGFIDNSHLEFVCGCGKKFILTQKQFRGGKYRCDSCTSKYSSLELKVMNFLKENNVKFITGYKYQECYDKLPLPFDFYLTEFNTLIEVDGKQHFFPAMSSHEEFETRKKHDEIKNEFCLRNNIPLIRIPYMAFEKSENWKIYLLQFVKD